VFVVRPIPDPVHLQTPRAAYVHVPFCAHRCGYCDFTLVAGKDHLIESYLSALERELAGTVEGTAGRGAKLDTLYFGGGTPSHLSPAQLCRLFELVLSRWELSPGSEFTIEANPVDLTDERIGVLAEYGVNRISLGVQSFDDQLLAVLERNHHGSTIGEVLKRLRGTIDNVSFDLIFAVPGQTLELWRDSLRQTVELGARHVSTYGLTFEKGTSFWSRRQTGGLQAAPEELEREMYAHAMSFLQSRGFQQYEISSFALPGFRSRHNQVYWSGRPYLAFGPGASRFIDGVRETNHRSVTTWLQRI
jgi:oxygen-independent coproporphyrinogen III oxidase